MTDPRPARAALLACMLAVALARGTAAGEPATLAIGYVEIAGDTRYERRQRYTDPDPVAAPRPFAGAELAVREGAIQGRAVSVSLVLERHTADSAAAAAEWILRGKAAGKARLVLVDADAGAMEEIASRTRDGGVLLFNVSAPEDSLRGEHCATHLMHTLPSDAMLADALVQYLVSRRWRDFLLLSGPTPRDALTSDAVRRAARRFGARLVGTRDFVPGNDPRDRDRNNISLLTAGVDYDVVLLADDDGEFGRHVPFQTTLPRPVVGSEGLSAAAWNWAYERHGAPQLERRFERREGRRMGAADWAAWVAAKAIVEAMVRTRTAQFEAIATYLRGDELNLDGYKGSPLSFRAWDNQLRQPVVLHTADAVIALAPVTGFLHPHNNLDTLGFDQPETTCRF